MYTKMLQLSEDPTKSKNFILNFEGIDKSSIGK